MEVFYFIFIFYYYFVNLDVYDIIDFKSLMDIFCVLQIEFLVMYYLLFEFFIYDFWISFFLKIDLNFSFVEGIMGNFIWIKIGKIIGS